MIKKFFPVESKQFNLFEKAFNSFNKDTIDRLEMFFPMWCMIAFQHYLIKSYDIAIFRLMSIDSNKSYIFSLIAEDLFGVVNIIIHTFLLLWLMNKFDFFGPFRAVKTDFQTNFLLFLVFYSLLSIIIFGKMMFGLILMLSILYFIYRSDSFLSRVVSLVFTLIAMIFSINMNEPIIASSAAIYLPILIISMFLKSQEITAVLQKYLLLIIFIFISTKELWFGFIGLAYLVFFNMYYYFTYKSKYNWLKLDVA